MRTKSECDPIELELRTLSQIWAEYLKAHAGKEASPLEKEEMWDFFCAELDLKDVKTCTFVLFLLEMTYELNQALYEKSRFSAGGIDCD